MTDRRSRLITVANDSRKSLDVIWLILVALAVAGICVAVPDVIFQGDYYDGIPKRQFGVAIGAILAGCVLVPSRVYTMRCIGLTTVLIGFVFLLYNVIAVAGWPWEY